MSSEPAPKAKGGRRSVNGPSVEDILELVENQHMVVDINSLGLKPSQLKSRTNRANAMIEYEAEVHFVGYETDDGHYVIECKGGCRRRRGKGS